MSATIRRSRGRRRLRPLASIALGILMAACAGGDGDPLSAVAGGMQNLADRMTGDSLHDALSERDVELAAATLQRALDTRPNGTPLSWTNGESGNAGSIRPVDAVMTGGGYPCRRYEETLRVDDRTAVYDARACRNDAGRWIWVE